MRLSRPKKHALTIDLIPLINIIFLLLVFFMLAGRLQQLDVVEVDPPMSQLGEERIGRMTTIFIAKDGTLAVNQDEVQAEDLPLILRTVLEKYPMMRITIKADRDVASTGILRLIKEIQMAGGHQITLVTQE